MLNKNIKIIKTTTQEHVTPSLMLQSNVEVNQEKSLINQIFNLGKVICYYKSLLNL